MKILMTIAMAMALAGCALPATEVKTGSLRPALVVQGAPAGAVLYVDGLQIGEAARYDGKAQKLMIEEGAHRIEIRQGGTMLHAQQIFAGAGETAVVAVGKEGAK
jgi:starvation-inducible outer membrane lipoprotein